MCKQVAYSHNTGKEHHPIAVLGLDSKRLALQLTTENVKVFHSQSIGAQRVTQ